MIKHIVAWNFSEANRAENIKRVKSLLDELPALIPEIKYYEVGVNLKRTENTKDLILISAFESLETLQTYSAHPEHQRVVKEVQKLVVDRVVVDYEG